MHLLALLFTVFIDSMGFGLVFPIFSPMIVNNESGIFSPEVSLATRGLVFGLLVSAYCLGQFFGGPILGSYSDRVGRKKVLIGAMWLAFVGYILASLGIVIQSLTVLFIARLLAGLSAGSFPVAQSVIADMSTKENKTKNFGLVGMSCWTGFVIGPFLGGKLAAYGFTVPFAVAAFFCLCNALLLLFKLRESLSNPNAAKVSWLHGVYQIKKAFSMPNLRGVFIMMFIFCLGWGFFTEFSPIFLTQRLGFNISQIANFYAWVGLWIAICQGVFIRILSRWIAPERLLTGGLLLLGAILPAMLFMKGMAGLFFLIPCIAFAQSLIFPNAATIVSNASSKESQGEMLGINSSVQWAAIALPPLFSGGLVALYPHLPVTVGSACMLVAFFVFLKSSKPVPVEAKVEVESEE